MLSQGQKRQEGLRRGDRLVAVLYRLVQAIFCLLGPRFAFGFFGWVGARLYPQSEPAKLVRRNVELVYADRGEEEREAIIQGIYKTLPRAMAEFILQPYWKRHGARLTQHNVDIDWAQPYLKNEKNAVFLIGHFSGWEAGVQFLSRHAKNVVGIYTAPRNPLLEPHFCEGRMVRGHSWRMYPRDLTDLQGRLTEALKAGASLIYALDAPLPGPMLPFLGLTSPTTLKPYALAAQTGAPLIPVYTRREANDQAFCVELEPPIFAKGASNADIIALATEMNQVYTRWIFKDPTHWYWTDKFFIPNKRWQERQAVKAA